MVAFTIMSSLTAIAFSGNTALSLLAVSRFGVGFGIGGCYPLSAAKSAESDITFTVAQKNVVVGLNLLFQVFSFLLLYL